MMALTQEQKAENHAKRLERDRAHRLRQKEVMAFRDDAEGQVSSEFSVSIEKARDKADSIRLERDRMVNDIEEKIKKLRELQEKVEENYKEPIAIARKEYSTLVDARNEALINVGKMVDEKFPDMMGDAMWSAACWAFRRDEEQR